MRLSLTCSRLTPSFPIHPPPPQTQTQAGRSHGGRQGQHQQQPNGGCVPTDGAPSTSCRSPFLESLPEAVCTHLLDFLPQWGVLALTEVSKDTQQAVMVALRSWDYIYARHRRSNFSYNKREYAWAVAAASQFLGWAPNLLHFCFRHVSVYGFTSFVRVMEGGAGARLRSLRLPGMGSSAQKDFVESVLKAGRLPLLETLNLYTSGYAIFGGVDWGGALEERGHLGLPSVTCIKRLCNHTEAAGLRCVWACCPPDRITHLDARNEFQLMALGEFLLGHPKFVALRSVYL